MIADPLSSTRIWKLHDCFQAGIPDRIKKVVASARFLDLHWIRRLSRVASVRCSVGNNILTQRFLFNDICFTVRPSNFCFSVWNSSVEAFWFAVVFPLFLFSYLITSSNPKVTWNSNCSPWTVVLFSFGFYFSCGSQLLQRVWEADLEACQLLIRGFQLKETSCCSSEEEENQMDKLEMAADGPSDSEKRKEDHFPKGTKWDSVPCPKHSKLKQVFGIPYS